MIAEPEGEQAALEFSAAMLAEMPPPAIEFDRGCTNCKLAGGAKTVCVAGDGPSDARMVIVGQNPGAEEDIEGRPFIGKAGRELNEMLLEASILRENVFVTNAVRCFTANNRAPSKREAAACAMYLIGEIANRRPEVIILLGNGPLQSVVDPNAKITASRGKPASFGKTFRDGLTSLGVPEEYAPLILPTIHPAATFHSPKGTALRAQIVEDFRLAVTQQAGGFTEIPTPWAWKTEKDQVYRYRTEYRPRVVAYDVETNGYPIWDERHRIGMIALDWGDDIAVFRNEHVREGIRTLACFFEQGVTLVGHNGSAYDRLSIKTRTGVDLPTEDTMLMAHLLDEDSGKGLETLAVRHLGVRPWKDEITWKWADGPANDEEWERFGLYNARDTRYTRLLYLKFRAELDADPALANYYDRFFLPFSRAIAQMEHNGTFVSLDGLAKNWGVFAIQKTRAETACRALVGNPNFNPGSHQQVRKVLFEDLKLPIQEWTDGDEASTNELSLKQLKFHVLTTGEHARTIALIDALLEYREAVKMIGTYLDKYARAALESNDGRIHPWYSLIRSVSRTSSNDQQWPRDVRMGGVFSAPPGKVRIGGDISQLELRNAAHLSQDPAMLEAFRRGDDLHRLLAAEITGKAPEDVLPEERSRAKPASFAYLYGAEPYTLEVIALTDYDLIMPRSETARMHNAFHSRWASIKTWYTEVWTRTSALGYARSPSGRIRRLPEINSTDRSKRLEALRQAINFEDQELGLVIAGLCLVIATDAGLLCTQFIHDAVYCEVDDTPEALAYAESVFASMQTRVPELLQEYFGITYSVPLVIEAKVERAK